MKACKDHSGERFGHLLAMWIAGRDKRSFYWSCQCDCGKISVIRVSSLTTGNTKSCGCRQRTGRLIHGAWRTPEYRLYCAAKDRCTNPSMRNWKYYGGRGIQFRFASFNDFINAVGWRPEKNLTLDRIDNNGHYESGNIRWATRSEQNHNRRPYKWSKHL